MEKKEEPPSNDDVDENSDYESEDDENEFSDEGKEVECATSFN